MAFSTIGAENPRAIRLSLSGVTLDAAIQARTGIVEPGREETNANQPGLLFVPSSDCSTQPVRVTLAAEQVSFCSPTSLSLNIVEDSLSDFHISYAGLNQINGYGIVNIKVTSLGHTPGMGKPIYYLGNLARYRQDVWDTVSANQDLHVTDGPSGIFWNETVSGIQVDFSLPTTSGTMRLRSIEWYIEHNARLWSFILTWDTEMQNAAGWEQASRIFSVQNSQGGNLPDTVIDLGKSFQASKAASDTTTLKGLADVGMPSWWSGVCNDNNFYPAMGVHSYTLGASWHGVQVCGPKYSMHLVHFFSGSYGEFEFQCVELVMRFLYLEWGIAPWGGNGNTIKDAPPSSIVFYPNGTQAIIPGDIITENASSSNSTGHAVVVTGVSLDANGTGTISIMEQNASSPGNRSLSVIYWQVQPDAWAFGQIIQGWLHVKSNQVVGNQKVYLPLVTTSGQ
jgi:hypothetical protein